MSISATALELIVDLRAMLRSVEWDGSDAYNDPICIFCKRDAPDYEKRGLPEYDRTEHHDADCNWLALMNRADAYLGDKPGKVR